MNNHYNGINRGMAFSIIAQVYPTLSHYLVIAVLYNNTFSAQLDGLLLMLALCNWCQSIYAFGPLWSPNLVTHH